MNLPVTNLNTDIRFYVKSSFLEQCHVLPDYEHKSLMVLCAAFARRTPGYGDEFLLDCQQVADVMGSGLNDPSQTTQMVLESLLPLSFANSKASQEESSFIVNAMIQEGFAQVSLARGLEDYVRGENPESEDFQMVHLGAALQTRPDGTNPAAH